MERKLSAKATRMRQRLAFSRSRSGRSRSSTVVSPIEDSPSPIRPRSASNPESPTYNGPTWDNDPDSSRGYTFTDELGYFRPESPFIDRQLIGEDLEADIKHACALLSHSIDRGIPAGLSYQSAVPDWVNGEKREQTNADIPASVDQHILLVPAAKDPEIETAKKHDSGVGMSFSPPSQPGRPHGNSLSGPDPSARFYNRRPPTSPPQSPSPGLRSRQSVAATIEEAQEAQPWEPSYTCSPEILSPYSPPSLTTEWTFNPTESPVSPLSTTDEKHETTAPQTQPTKPPKCDTKTDSKPPGSTPTSPSTPISPPDASLGEAGRTWLRASKEIQGLIEEKKAKTKPKSLRFYSSCNRSLAAFDSREWLARNCWEHDGSVYEETSMDSSKGTRTGTATPRLDSVSTNEELPGGYPYQAWAGRGMSYSSSCLGDEFKHQENVYSVVVPSEPRLKKRKKASLLFRKLAGIGMRWKEGSVR